MATSLRRLRNVPVLSADAVPSRGHSHDGDLEARFGGVKRHAASHCWRAVASRRFDRWRTRSTSQWCPSIWQPLGLPVGLAEGRDQPVVSTLNNPTATVVANAAIVPAGANGAIDVYAYNTTDLSIDINGYFARREQVGYRCIRPRRAACWIRATTTAAVPGRENCQCCGKSLCSSQQRRGLRLQRDRGAARLDALSDLVARRRETAGGLDAERLGWLHHIEHGDCPDEQRFHRRLRRCADATDSRHLRLLRAVKQRRHILLKPRPRAHGFWTAYMRLTSDKAFIVTHPMKLPTRTWTISKKADCPIRLVAHITYKVTTSRQQPRGCHLGPPARRLCLRVAERSPRDRHCLAQPFVGVGAKPGAAPHSPLPDRIVFTPVSIKRCRCCPSRLPTN